MNQIPDNHLRGFIDNRLPGREKIERIRAAGIVAEDEFVQEFAETLLDIRQGVRGGHREQKVRHWNATRSD